MFRRSLPFAIVMGLSCLSVEIATVMAPAPAFARTSVALKLRRIANQVDLVVSGLGDNPRLISQNRSGSRWLGRLRGTSSSTLTAPQDLVMPSLGLASVGLKAGRDATFELSVRAMEGAVLSDPVVSADGANLIVSFPRLSVRSSAVQSGRLDLSRPGRVQSPVLVPSMQARASAPPLGDIAVGSMLLSNRSYVAASGPSVSLTLNNAPAKDALMSLARLGGYGFMWVSLPPPRTPPRLLLSG